MSSRITSSRRKSVYERIEDTRRKISETEEALVQLKTLLSTQTAERDDLEMHQLFDFIRKNNISLDQAKNMMSK
jgi:hypothetical protein